VHFLVHTLKRSNKEQKYETHKTKIQQYFMFPFHAFIGCTCVCPHQAHME